MDKKTLVLGATPDESRYAYLASNRLVRWRMADVQEYIESLS